MKRDMTFRQGALCFRLVAGLVLSAGPTAWAGPLIVGDGTPRSDGFTDTAWSGVCSNQLMNSDAWWDMAVYGLPAVMDWRLPVAAVPEEAAIEIQGNGFLATAPVWQGAPLEHDLIVFRDGDPVADILMDSLREPEPGGADEVWEEEGSHRSGVTLFNLLFGVCIFLILMLGKRA